MGLVGLVIIVVQLPFLTTSAHAQDRTDFEGKNFLYGVRAGCAINKIELYYIQGGSAYALKQGNHSLTLPGCSLAVIADRKMGNRFSLRAMPGITLFKGSWEPKDITVLPNSTDNYTIESVCGELPVDVTYHPFRLGSFSPYQSAGLSYSLDLASLRGNRDRILRPKPHV